MRIAFCTCVQIGRSCIESVLELGGRFDLFLTLHDHKATSKSGRIYLDDLAQEHGVPLYKLNHINDPDVEQILVDRQIDWLFIIGWSQIASSRLLSVPHKGVIGAHPTLLPEGRGRAAVPWAILKGMKKTGVTFFKMDEGVDTGPILDQLSIDIASNETATELYSKVNQAHVLLMPQIWPKLMSDTLVERVQDEQQATYWPGRTPADGEITPEMTLDQVDRLVRATTHPYPGAYVTLASGGRVVVWGGGKAKSEEAYAIQCSDGVFYTIDYERRED
jgi:methionyl-tRNA formyltransferase